MTSHRFARPGIARRPRRATRDPFAAPLRGGRVIAVATALVAPALTAGCGNGGISGDDVGGPTTSFLLRVEQVGVPHAYLRSGDLPALAPGEWSEIVFTAGRGHRLVFAMMFSESNDFFFAPVGAGLPLYDQDGNANAGDVTANLALWDAGTEINQEPGLGPDQAPRQAAPDTGAPDPQPWARLAPNDFDNLPLPADVLHATLIAGPDQTFRLRFENVSTAATLPTSDGLSKAVPLSAGAWALHGGTDPLLTLGDVAHPLEIERLAEDGDAVPLTSALGHRTGFDTSLSPGAWLVHREGPTLFDDPALEQIAEDGDPSELDRSLARRVRDGRFGVFDPTQTREVFEIELAATPGDRLSFATMFVESNDVFLAPPPEGLALFDGATPRSGDVTGELAWWDAGTEVNQEPGVGNDQAPRQLAPGQGEAEDLPIIRVDARDDGFFYPPVSATVRVTLTPRP